MDIAKIRSVFANFATQLWDDGEFRDLIPKSTLNVRLLPVAYESGRKQAIKFTVVLECPRKLQLNAFSAELISSAAADFVYENGLTEILHEIDVSNNVVYHWSAKITRCQTSNDTAQGGGSGTADRPLYDQGGHHFEMEAGWDIRGGFCTCRWCIISKILNEGNYERIAGAVGGYSGWGAFELEEFYLEQDSRGRTKRIVIEGNCDWTHEVSLDIQDVTQAAHNLLLRWNDDDDWNNLDELRLAKTNRNHPDLVHLDDMLRLRTDDNPYSAKLAEKIGLTGIPGLWFSEFNDELLPVRWRVMNAVDELWNQRKPLAGYPVGVASIPELIARRAFFPGGSGLYVKDTHDPLPSFPTGGVMILGHNFDSKIGYEKSKDRGYELDTSPTWKWLLKLLDEVQIDPACCFFTNFFVGLIESAKSTGRFPGASDPAFVEHCRSFLIQQLRVQRPVLVLTLGIHVPPQIAALSPELAKWRKAHGFKDIDSAGPVVRQVTFPQLPGFRTDVVALTHPSLRRRNVSQRTYADQAGEAAELAMIRTALDSLPRSASRAIVSHSPANAG